MGGLQGATVRARKEGEREEGGRKEEGTWGDKRPPKGAQGPAPGSQVRGREFEQGKAGKQVETS